MVGGVHGRGACVVGGMCGRVHVWQGACMAGGVHDRGHVWQGACMAGGHAWQERWPLQWTVRILLECILLVTNLV